MIFLILASVVLTIIGTMIMSARHNVFRLTQPNVLQVMFLSHLAAQLIPAIIIALEPGNLAAGHYLFYCSLATVLIPLGGLFADMIVGVRKSQPFYLQPIDRSPIARERFTSFFLVYLALCFTIFVSYVIWAPPMPLYDLIFGYDDIVSLRVARREAADGARIYGMAQRFFMPVLFLLGFLGRKYFTGGLLRALAWGAMGIALLYNAWPGNKTPVATLFVMAIFVLLIRSSEIIPGLDRAKAAWAQRQAKRRVVRGAVAMGLLAALYPILIFTQLPAGRNGIGYIFEAVFTRIFFSPAQNTYSAFELFWRGQYTYFADIDAVASLLGWQHINLSQIVSIYNGNGAFTNAPPAAIGNFYAQGGGVVVVLGVLAAAMVFKITENILRTRKAKTPLTLAIYAALIFGAFRFSWANFHSILLSELYAPMCVTAVLWVVFGRVSVNRQPGMAKRVSVGPAPVGIPDPPKI